MTALAYSQVLGLSLVLCGTVFFIGTVVDAVSDPLVGGFSHGLQTRWGRRHPLMLATALPLGISFYLLFQPPEKLSEMQLFAWFTAMYVGMQLGKSFYSIPHMALDAELSGNYEERTSVFSWNWMMQYVGMALIGFFIFHNNKGHL